MGVTYLGSDVAIVTLAGEHELSANGLLARQLAQLVRTGERVIVDLSALENVDASMIDTLVQADALARERGLTLTLQLGVETPPAGGLELTRIRQCLPFASSREEAVSIARSNG